MLTDPLSNAVGTVKDDWSRARDGPAAARVRHLGEVLGRHVDFSRYRMMCRGRVLGIESFHLFVS